MEFSRQEYWSGLPFPPPGDLPDPGIKPGSPALQADSLLTDPLLDMMPIKKKKKEEEWDKEIFPPALPRAGFRHNTPSHCFGGI